MFYSGIRHEYFKLEYIFVSVRCDKNTYELVIQPIAILCNAIFIPLLILILAVAKNCTYYFGITRARNIAQFQK